MIDGQFYPGQPIQFVNDRPFRNPWHRKTFLEITDIQGLSSGRQIILDAGDGNSLPAASTKWLDVSGNGYDFFRGTTAGAEGSDPTINGTQDARTSSEYLSFDGGDVAVYDAANETWMTNLHKDNAAFTIVTWIYWGSVPGGGDVQRIVGTRKSSSETGIAFADGGSGVPQFVCSDGSSNILNISGAQTFVASTWQFVALSLNEATGANGAIIQVNGVQSLHTSTYSGPSTGNATSTLRIGASNVLDGTFNSGTRMGMFGMWSTALTATQLTNLFTATRYRYGV